MKEISKNTITVVVAVGLGVGMFFAGYSIGQASYYTAYKPSTLANTTSAVEDKVDFGPFWKAWTILDEKFVASNGATSTAVITDQEKVWGAIHGLADAYGDPYTTFFPPVESEFFENEINGNFEGVGIEISIKDDVLTVVAPLKNTPAYHAGILSGDRIVGINDQSTLNMSIDEAIKNIRGEKGTTVVLTIIREGKDAAIEVPVIRGVIDIPTINTEVLDGGIYLIGLYNFSAHSTELFEDALRDFIDSGYGKLILDLRGNPGGYLDASIEMASWFLPPGKIVVREDYGEGKEQKIHRSKGYNSLPYGTEMVVLINGGSASASEILAGALKEHGIASTVGKRTFGKGSVQEVVRVTSDTSIKVTVAQWLTPEGLSISGNGVEPDVEVDMSPEDYVNDLDPQLEKAIELLLNK